MSRSEKIVQIIKEYRANYYALAEKAREQNSFDIAAGFRKNAEILTELLLNIEEFITNEADDEQEG